LRSAPIGRAQNDDQEHERQNSFGNQAGKQRIAAGRVSIIAVRSEAAAQIEARFAARNHKKKTRGEYRPGHLRNDVRQQFGSGKSLGYGQTD